MRRYAILSGLVTVFLVLCAFRLGQATTSVTFDATWWRDLLVTQRLGAVQGVISGYEAGYRRGQSYGSFLQLSQDSWREIYFEHQFFTGVRKKYLLQFETFKVRGFKDGTYKRADDDAQANAQAEMAKNLPWMKEPTFPDNFGTYADGITHFYENNPTKADWSPGHVMECLSSSPPSDCKL